MVDEISESEKIPKSFLAKIFQSLVKGGLVRSVRGARGGFRLARPPEEITVLEILECIENGLALQKCVANHPTCVVADRRLSGCPLCRIFGEAQHRVNEVFSKTTLKELLEQSPAHAAH